MNLLIVGGESDHNTQRVVDQAHMRGFEYTFWNTDEPHAKQIAWDFDSPNLDLGELRLRPKAIYLRWNVFGGDSQANFAIHDTMQAYAGAWPEVRILNRKTLHDGNNKAFNLRLAIDVGFTIPNSIVMCDLTPLTTMPSPETQIAKPLGGGAHTKSIDGLIQDPMSLHQMPPQFIQEKLDGENLRLFSIGGDLFCFHLVTSHLDYRDDQSVEVRQVPIPESIIEPTKKLVAAKGFDYCALDFRCRDGMNEPVFLEVNSFPMFVRFDDAGQNCLVDSILRFLLD